MSASSKENVKVAIRWRPNIKREGNEQQKVGNLDIVVFICTV